MARWLRALSGQGGEGPPREPGGSRLARKVAEAQLKLIAEKVERGEAEVADLKQAAIDALAVAFASAQTSRDLTRTAGVVRQWLADEAGAPGGASITAIQVILNQPATVQGNGTPAALDDGHARPGSLETNGLRVRLNGHESR